MYLDIVCTLMGCSFDLCPPLSCAQQYLCHILFFRCSNCIHTKLFKKLTAESVVVSDESFEEVHKICYLGYMISAGGGAEESMWLDWY